MAAFIVKSQSEETGFVLDVSSAVAERVRAERGRIFIWLEHMSDAWALEKVSTSPPPADREFDDYEVDGFTLSLEKGVSRGEGIRLMLSPWPPFEPMAIPGGAEIAVLRRVPAGTARFTV